jgi:murein DD-endopeptidase MepM/ murein hydrolase activator NlpD
VTPRLALPLLRTPERMRIAQPFGANPEAYGRFGMRGHNGLDFEAEDGELVVAVDDGEVVEVRLDVSGYGVTVRLSHAWGESRYAHGQPYSVPLDFDLGHVARQGERIFLAGSTGSADITHLHFGLRLRAADGSLDYSQANGFGGYADPLPYLREALGLPAEALATPLAGKSRKAGAGR